MTKATQVEDFIIGWFMTVNRSWARKVHVTPIPIRTKVRGRWQITGLRPNPKMVGFADVMASMNRISYRIEVKVGKDKESPEQRADRLTFERSRGNSMIVKSVDDFLEQMEELKKKGLT